MSFSITAYSVFILNLIARRRLHPALVPVSAAEHKSVPKHVLFFAVIVDIYLWFTECTDFPRVLKITCCIAFCVKYFNRVVVLENILLFMKYGQF